MLNSGQKKQDTEETRYCQGGTESKGLSSSAFIGH